MKLRLQKRQLRDTSANPKRTKDGSRRICRHTITSTLPKQNRLGGSTDTGAGLDEGPHMPDQDGVSLPDPKRQTNRLSTEATSDVETGDDPDWGDPQGNS